MAVEGFLGMMAEGGDGSEDERCGGADAVVLQSKGVWWGIRECWRWCWGGRRRIMRSGLVWLLRRRGLESRVNGWVFTVCCIILRVRVVCIGKARLLGLGFVEAEYVRSP